MKSKEKELELNVSIFIEDELPDDPEISVTHYSLLSIVVLLFIYYLPNFICNWKCLFLCLYCPMCFTMVEFALRKSSMHLVYGATQLVSCVMENIFCSLSMSHYGMMSICH